jgi:hypothetical protein
VDRVAASLATTRSNENKIAERNYAPNDNQEIKDLHPIDAESSHYPVRKSPWLAYHNCAVLRRPFTRATAGARKARCKANENKSDSYTVRWCDARVGNLGRE